MKNAKSNSVTPVEYVADEAQIELNKTPKLNSYTIIDPDSGTPYTFEAEDQVKALELFRALKQRLEAEKAKTHKEVVTEPVAEEAPAESEILINPITE